MRTTLLLLLMMLTSLSVWANETFTVDDLTYMVVSESSKTVNVWQYSGTMPENYNMVIPASVTYPNNSTLYTVIGINSIAFMNETNLKSVSIPASVTRINQQAFEGCTNLETVSIPEANGVTDVGDAAFSGTKWLNDQPNGVVYVGKVAYLGKNVSGDISINDGAVSISDEAFLNCTGLTSVTIPNSVTYIGSSAFFGCTNLTSITIPNGVTEIGGSAFSGSGLTSITIPNGVTYIDNEAFKGCTSLTSVTIPNSVTSIDDGAFQGCTSLTSITIPASVQIIMSGAFYECYNLKTVTIYAPSCYLFDDDAFFCCNDDLQIYVFSYLVDDYQGAENWSKYAGIIKGLTGGYCGVDDPTTVGVYENTNVVWVLTGASPNYTLTISGTGAMANYADANSQPWAANRSDIKTIVINDDVTSIGDNAFAYSGLTSVNIPASVTSIGESVFYNCTNLTSVALNGPTTIGSGAFPSNTTVTIASGLYLHNGSEVLCGDVTDMSKLNSKTLQKAVKITLPTGIIASGTNVFNQSDGTYALPNATVTIAADTTYKISNVDATGADLTNNGDGTYTFTVGTTDVTVTATLLTNVTAPSTFDLTANLAEGSYWTSFYFGGVSYKIDESEDATAYTATRSGDKLTLTSIGKNIPKNTAVIIKGTDISISLTRDDNIPDYTGDNELQGVNYETPQADGYTYYVLSKKGDNFGFFKLASSNMLGAHKAFIEVAPSNNAPAFFGFDDSDSEDGIENVNVNDNVNDNAIYNLSGQKLSRPQKGINIVNGRKVLF